MDQEVDRAAVTRVLDLADVLELIVDRLDQGTLAEQNLLLEFHQLVGHVLANAGDELEPTLEKLLEEG